MDSKTRDYVRTRAGRCCEYCGLHEDQSPLASLHVEHVRPIKHRGSDSLDNLALACIDCNLHKGSNVAGYDPETGQLSELFHPRLQRWADHFAWQGVLIVGITPVGRTTVEVLQMNAEERLRLRVATSS